MRAASGPGGASPQAQPSCFSAKGAFQIYGRMDDEDRGFIWTVGHLRYGILLDLSRLRGDPRYEALIREANRAWGLNPDGSLPDSVDVSFDTPAGG